MRSVALYDLGNTLAAIKHRAYVESVKPRILPAYDRGNLEANLEYETVLAEGLKEGRVDVQALSGVKEKLERNVSEEEWHNAIFSTCLPDAIEAVLEQLGIRRLVVGGEKQGIYSTFYVNPETPNIKTPKGFRRVNELCGGYIWTYADDKIDEAQRAREGFTPAALIYIVGGKAPIGSGILSVDSIADINTLHGNHHVVQFLSSVMEGLRNYPE